MRGLLPLIALLALSSATAAQAASDPASGVQGSNDASMKGMDMPGMDRAPENAPAPQSSADMPGMDMQGMDMQDMDMPSTGALGPYPMIREASGTSWQPDAAEHHGLHAMVDGWMLMGHMMLAGSYDTQSAPRGDDKTFLEGMLMGMARRNFGAADVLNFRVMLSPEPFMGKSGYPLLLATGETANGTAPLIDRQHPHDLLMELSSSFSHAFSNEDGVFFYVGYPGEPALGPPAFMHRISGMDIPEAPITHHWLDSTHITFGVLTVGYVHDDFKFEVSQFTGREPDQNRFDFNPVRLDSTSARTSWNPDANWSLQVSWGFLKSPEQLAPAIDENRWTASATYVMPLGGTSSVAATIAWGLKQLSDGANLNGVLFEVEYKPSESWTLFTRPEWEENNELLTGGAIEQVGKVSFGIIHDWSVAEHWKIGLGASYDFDIVPRALKASYGNDPHGAMIFTRIVAD